MSEKKIGTGKVPRAIAFQICKWLDANKKQMEDKDLDTIAVLVSKAFTVEISGGTIRALCKDAGIAKFWKEKPRIGSGPPNYLSLVKAVKELYVKLGEPVPEDLQ